MGCTSSHIGGMQRCSPPTPPLSSSVLGLLTQDSAGKDYRERPEFQLPMPSWWQVYSIKSQMPSIVGEPNAWDAAPRSPSGGRGRAASFNGSSCWGSRQGDHVPSLSAVAADTENVWRESVRGGARIRRGDGRLDFTTFTHLVRRRCPRHQTVRPTGSWWEPSFICGHGSGPSGVFAFSRHCRIRDVLPAVRSDRLGGPSDISL
jgi:hypothetical protein